MGKKIGFTMAEILITLGIIGVVAALTMPALIANHRKVVIATQLKKAYTTLAQAFTMAQKDYGDIAEWNFKPQNPQNSDSTSIRDALYAFAHTYLIPYLSVITDCGTGSGATAECTYTWYATDGTALNWSPASNNNYRFILNNSILITLLYDNYQGDYSGGSILIYVDINGKQKPNTLSKDIFVMNIKSSTAKFEMYGAGNSRDRLMDGAISWGCAYKVPNSNSSIYCGALIQQDGWQILDDYPWL